jgi:hypothetical protein
VTRPTTVVSSAVLESCVATQSWVNREYQRGHTPVLRVSVVEVMLPALTTCRQPVRKSSIQLQREVFSPRVLSVVTSLDGTMVLNTEL